MTRDERIEEARLGLRRSQDWFDVAEDPDDVEEAAVELRHARKLLEDAQRWLPSDEPPMLRQRLLSLGLLTVNEAYPATEGAQLPPWEDVVNIALERAAERLEAETRQLLDGLL